MNYMKAIMMMAVDNRISSLIPFTIRPRRYPQGILTEPIKGYVNTNA